MSTFPMLYSIFHRPLKSLKAIYFVDDGKPKIRGMFLILDFLPSSAILSLPLSLLNLWQGIGGDISLKRLVKQNWWLLVYLIILQLGVLKNIPQSLYILCNLNFLAQSVQISEFGQNGIHETVYELSLCMLGKFWKTFSIILIIAIFKTEYSKEGEVQGIFSMLLCKIFHSLGLLHHH